MMTLSQGIELMRTMLAWSFGSSVVSPPAHWRAIECAGLLSQVITLMAFMLALMFVFEISKLEVEKLEKGKEGIIGATPDVETGRSTGNAPPQQGHTVNLPPAATEGGVPLSDIYGEVSGEDSIGTIDFLCSSC